MNDVEFYLPEEIKDTSYQKILSEMLGKIPDKYDKTEGGFVFDFLAPSALECAELIQFWLALALKTNFWMWAKGRWLDYHAHDCGLARRAATHSYGDLEVTTTRPVTFPQGFIFSVPGENSVPAIDFELLAETTVDGTETLRVRAVEAGLSGNVAADSVTIQKNPLKNVALITNPEPFTGGTTAEDDESLRGRIKDFYAGRGSSFVGNRADYERWAKMIDGVGYAHCIPCYFGANTLKIVLCDSNGDPATGEICAEVEKFIFGKNHYDINRLAPIGIVRYEVAPPSPHDIKISLKPTLSLDSALVKKNISADLNAFFKTLSNEENVFGVLKYVQVSKVLAGVEGLEDFKHLRINGGLENISFAEDCYPRLTEIVFGE